ncbi:MAG: hypothetical protein VKJ44_10735 [Synechococcus sp.]|nr:hypothetical protein [Synechococcus sp.]
MAGPAAGIPVQVPPPVCSSGPGLGPGTTVPSRHRALAAAATGPGSCPAGRRSGCLSGRDGGDEQILRPGDARLGVLQPALHRFRQGLTGGAVSPQPPQLLLSRDQALPRIQQPDQPRSAGPAHGPGPPIE